MIREVSDDLPDHPLGEFWVNSIVPVTRIIDLLDDFESHDTHMYISVLFWLSNVTTAVIDPLRMITIILCNL